VIQDLAQGPGHCAALCTILWKAQLVCSVYMAFLFC